MVNRLNQNADTGRDKILRQEAAAINYISDNRTSSRSQPKHIDDLIVSLANAHENRRVRQVTEWEKMGQYIRPAV